MHTFSSLNKDFIPQYSGALAGADKAVVFFSEHALKMKKMPQLENQFVKEAFDHPNVTVFSNNKDLEDFLIKEDIANINLLLMTSGNFDKLPIKSIFSIEATP